jgi:choline dehydrogenase
VAATREVVIVGAGSAGCVLAARLSEDPDRLVTLLEAGPDYPDPAALPPEIASGLAPAFTHDWGYRSEPGSLGRALNLYRGCLVGGSSAVNATIALRGSPGDYDEWAALGNPGWSFAEVLPFFRRLERDRDFGDPWHGRDGPLPIRRLGPEELGPVHQAFLDACAAIGHPRVGDQNAPGAVGAGPVPFNTFARVRQSTALTYLAQARGRPNLTVRAGALVDRLVVEDRRLVGVRLAERGETLRADGVVLAAGSYGSPAILLRSGVGPAADLGALGIPVVVDRPGVGANLIEHANVGVVFSSDVPAQPGASWFGAMLSLLDPGGAGVAMHIISGHRPGDAPDDPAIAWMLVGLLKPQSRGRLRLRAVDPAAAPIIETGLLTHAADLAALVVGVRVARRLGRTDPLAGLLGEEQFPGVAVAEAGPELEEAVRANADVYFHPVGTCRMGAADDPLAVVDARGRVHGLDGLWVVDASIMPTVPGAGTNLPTIMLAERCAGWLT